MLAHLDQNVYLTRGDLKQFKPSVCSFPFLNMGSDSLQLFSLQKLKPYYSSPSHVSSETKLICTLSV